MMAELMRYRLHKLFVGQRFNELLGVGEPWRLREAAEEQLRNIIELTWTEYKDEPTPEKLEELKGVVRALYDQVINSMSWVQHLSHWEHMKMLPFPTSPTAIELWMRDRIENLVHDETAPWWQELPRPPASQVTAIRRAKCSTKKMDIWLTMYPILSTLEHASIDVSHHLLSYKSAPYTGIGTWQPEPRLRWKDPIIGAGGSMAWGGFLSPTPDWSYLKAENLSPPEPILETRGRPVRFSKRAAEMMQAALASEYPTLFFLRFGGTTAPILAVPNIHLDTQIWPLYGGGFSLSPTKAGNSVSGYMTVATGDGHSILDTVAAPDGFIIGPGEGRPMREGQLTEILPYA
jgi:hypothetical protein